MTTNQKLQIPRLVYEDVEPSAFVAACSKLTPPTQPKFALRDVVIMAGAFGRKLPAVVAGVEARSEKCWHYTLIRPRDYDGGLERVAASEEDLMKP